jgi:signal transduction histidine kinase
MKSRIHSFVTRSGAQWQAFKKTHPIGRATDQYKEVIVVFLATLLIVYVGMRLAVPTAKQPPSQNGTQRATITVDDVYDVVGHDDTSADPGATTTWRKSINISDNTQALDGEVIEEISPDQKLSGDLTVPTGWTAEYSTDFSTVPAGSRTWTAYAPGNAIPLATREAITFFKLKPPRTNGFQPARSATALPRPLQQTQLTTNNQPPSMPVVYNNRVYTVLKSQRGGAGVNMLDCYDLSTKARCTTMSFPTYFSTTVGALGAGSRNLNTAANMEIVLDDGTYGNAGRIYVPGQSGNNYGVICADLETLQNCGFTVMGAATAPAGANPSLVSGFTQQAGKIYGDAADIDQTYQTVVCFDMQTDAICSGYTASTTGSNPTYKISEHASQYESPGTHVISGTKMYWLMNYRINNDNLFNPFLQEWETQRSFGTVLACFDVVARTPCSGWPISGGYSIWPQKYYDGLPLERPSTVYIWKNGADQAVCYLVVNGAESFTLANYCFNLVDGSQLGSVPGILGNPQPTIGATWFMSPNVTTMTVNGHLRSYFAYRLSEGATKGGTACFDWTTQATCEQWPPIKYGWGINGGFGGDEGYYSDGACLYASGRSGYIWSMDPDLGEVPCRNARNVSTVTAGSISGSYCDGQTHTAAWNKVRVLYGQRRDFESLNVTVKNTSGATLIAATNIRETGELDISGISVVDNPSLVFEMNGRTYSGSPWGTSQLPQLSVSVGGEDVQYCYSTVDRGYCNATQIRTKSTALFKSEDDTYFDDSDSIIPITQPDNVQCFMDLQTSLTANKSTVANGESVTYTINVTNKANPDADGRGTAYFPIVAFTVPVGMENVTIQNGTYSPVTRLAIFNPSAITGKATQTRTVTFRTPQLLAALTKPAIYLAATTQVQLPTTAYAQVVGDRDNADNLANNNSVVWNKVTPDPPGTTPTPAPTSTPDPELMTDVETPSPSPTTSPDGSSSSPQVSPPPTTEQNYTPESIRGLVPATLVAPVEAAFKKLDEAVQPIPPKVAQAIPYGTIAILGIFALVYAFQAAAQIRDRRRLQALAKRYNQAETNRKNYIDLTSHYLHTPITTMQTAVELLASLKTVPNDILTSLKNQISLLSMHADELLDETQVLSQQSQNTALLFERTTAARLFTTGSFIIPVAGVLIVSLGLNAVFVWAHKYDGSLVATFSQAALFILGAFAVAQSYFLLQRQRRVTAVASDELKLEEDINASRSAFIKSSGSTLEADTAGIEKLAPAIAKVEHGDNFMAGLASLKRAVAKLSYLNSVSSASPKAGAAHSNAKHVEEILKPYGPVALKARITLAASIQPDFSTSLKPADLIQLITSVLNNSMKFTKAGGSVEVRATSDDKKATLIVKDTGIGIKKERIDQLFTPFSRATDTRAFDYEGIGLDLYLDKLVVEQAGGKIVIKSDEGKGTTVTVTLPL